METARTNTQKLVTLHLDHTLFEAAEQARGRVNRSQWIRDAIAEKCAREGLEVPEDAVFAPDRARKGGSKWSPETLRKEDPPASHMLNDEPGGEGQGSQQKSKYPPKSKKKPKPNQ